MLAREGDRTWGEWQRYFRSLSLIHEPRSLSILSQTEVLKVPKGEYRTFLDCVAKLTVEKLRWSIVCSEMSYLISCSPKSSSPRSLVAGLPTLSKRYLCQFCGRWGNATSCDWNLAAPQSILRVRHHRTSKSSECLYIHKSHPTAVGRPNLRGELE